MTSTRIKSLIGFAAAAALGFAGPALATTGAKTAAKPAAAAKAKPAAAKPAAAKPVVAKATPAKAAVAAKPAAPARVAVVSRPAPRAVAARPAAKPVASGRMVRSRLANGQYVTYNCSLPGNATKQACKR